MYRAEYPRPQMMRPSWINLNGAWEYATDRAVSGVDRKLYEDSAVFHETIEVPFCRESVLSGIGDKDFCECVWYRKRLELPEAWDGKRILLHIGACDYRTTLWVNGKEVGTHVGGMVSFSFDLTSFLCGREVMIVIRAFDDTRSQNQPGGKQSDFYYSHGCSYTRTTGIWQTVWLEAVEQSYVSSVRYYPDIHAGTLTVHAKTVAADGMVLTARALYEGREMGEATAVVYGSQAVFTLALKELHLWEVGNGRLYDLELTLGADAVKSYFGMRNVGWKEGIMYLNGKPVFQRLVLDQGYYPDGILTAPSDEALVRDIEYSMAMGFNGARLHQKIFEPRFLYHCDRLGYIVWGEHGNWGLNIARSTAWENFFPEWVETLERDFNHPAIIGWCPLNETQVDSDVCFIQQLAALTRAIDPTRLYIETSGWVHVPGVADMVDTHDYTQDPELFAQKYAPLEEGKEIPAWRCSTVEEGAFFPTFISEYGGIKWDAGDASQNSWGYGNAPKTPEEYINRFKGLTEAILNHPCMGGLCYTQLTDVEQEQNGLYTYHRKAKFDPAIFHEILTQRAAIEKNNTEE